jgi:hypothetical protein
MQGVSRAALSPLRVFYRDRDIVVAEADALCVVVWRGAVTKYPFEKQRAGLAAVVEKHPGKAGFLIVIEPSCKPPDDDLRHESTAMLESHGNRLTCVGVVVEGEGFRAAITRGVLSGMVLLMRNRKSPISFFSNVRSTAKWMSTHVEIPSVDYVASIVEEVRSNIMKTQPGAPDAR